MLVAPIEIEKEDEMDRRIMIVPYVVWGFITMSAFWLLLPKEISIDTKLALGGTTLAGVGLGFLYYGIARLINRFRRASKPATPAEGEKENR